MLDPFQLPFMQRAVAEIVLLAPLAGLLGAQIVLRRLAFFTHGVGTAAFPGLVVAGPLGIPPALAALAVGGGFAVLLERLGRGAGLARDAGTALLLVAALAVGIVLASDVFETSAGVDRLLFGSLLAIGDAELLVTAAVLIVAVGAVAGFRRGWIESGFDDLDPAKPGLRRRAGDLVLLTVVAMAAIVAIDAVGALLVGAVLVVPAATARLFARSVPGLELGAAALALAEGIVGLLVAFELDAPPGAVIAVLGAAVFAICLTARELVPRPPRRRVTA